MKKLAIVANELGLKPESYHAKSTALCAIVTHNKDAWYDSDRPAGRLLVVGYCTMAGQPLIANAECAAALTRTLRDCGEFADQIRYNGPEYIQIAGDWQKKTTLATE